MIPEKFTDVDQDSGISACVNYIIIISFDLPKFLELHDDDFKDILEHNFQELNHFVRSSQKYEARHKSVRT